MVKRSPPLQLTAGMICANYLEKKSGMVHSGAFRLSQNADLTDVKEIVDLSARVWRTVGDVGWHLAPCLFVNPHPKADISFLKPETQNLCTMSTFSIAILSVLICYNLILVAATTAPTSLP